MNSVLQTQDHGCSEPEDSGEHAAPNVRSLCICTCITHDFHGGARF